MAKVHVETNEKKCEYHKCDHIYEEDEDGKRKPSHMNGSCFHITQEDEKNKPTNKKFCPCNINGSIKLFSDLHFMEPDVDDTMVTKTCGKCKKEVLMNIEEKLCVFCRNNVYQ